MTETPRLNAFSGGFPKKWEPRERRFNTLNPEPGMLNTEHREAGFFREKIFNREIGETGSHEKSRDKLPMIVFLYFLMEN